jgi:1-acyl-sn-glycerol-3-phosphate acyltransferase
MLDKISDLWYEGAFCISMTGMTLGWSLRTEGMHHVPAHGPALVIANHQSYLDPVLVGLAVRRPLCYLARHTLFRHALFTALIRSLNAIPINQEGVGIEGMRTTLHQLEAGKAVLVFPEGERTPDGALQPLKPGIQLLIKRLQAPIIPVGLAGAYTAWPRWRRWPTLAPLFLPPGPGTIAVAVGKPLASRQLVDLPRERLLTVLFQEMRNVHSRAERLRRKT